MRHKEVLANDMRETFLKPDARGTLEALPSGKGFAFLPAPLPPKIDLGSDAIIAALGGANRAIGRLDSIKDLLPDMDMFLYLYQRKEALVSSQIEGTQSSLSDLFAYEADVTPTVPVDDVEEVSNYIAALNYALDAMQRLPLSSRLIRETHARLMQGVRGSTKTPGEFRRSQVWIGGSTPDNARFVPPLHTRLADLMTELETFIHADALATTPLVKAAIIHAQFETIHPFLDGNGRLGRLLIPLYLIQAGVLEAPMLYISLYLKNRRAEYYDHLNATRAEEGWEPWVAFFLEGVTQTATAAYTSARTLRDLVTKDAQIVKAMGRTSATAFQVHADISRHILVTAPSVAERTGLSANGARAALNRLAEVGVVETRQANKRDRVYVYQTALDVLAEGAEPL